MSKFCPYCHCLILVNGFCRNNKCVLGNGTAITSAQMLKIEELHEDMNREFDVKKYVSLSKVEAIPIIKKLIDKKNRIRLQEAEEEE